MFDDDINDTIYNENGEFVPNKDGFFEDQEHYDDWMSYVEHWLDR